jgi:hypothetical protein
MSEEFFDEYLSSFEGSLRDASRKLSDITVADLTYADKKACLDSAEGFINDAFRWTQRMQTSGAVVGPRVAQFKSCKAKLRSIRKRRKKAEEALKRTIFTDNSLSEKDRQALGNQVAEEGIDMLQEGIEVLDCALEEADETERELLSQGETILGAKQKVKDTTSGLSLASRLVSQMQNRDMRNRCYITLMWLAMILTVLGTAILLFSDSSDESSSSEISSGNEQAAR